MTAAKSPEAPSNSKPESFHDKLLAVQKACHELHLTPEAEGQVQNRTYKYLTIQKIHAAVLPILHEAGLTWTCYPTWLELTGTPALTYTLSPEDVLEGITDCIPLIGCSDMQKLGSAITYARRYCLLAVLGLTPDEDDDGSIASKATVEPSKGKRQGVPTIPQDRARGVLISAVKASLAEIDDDTKEVTLSPALQAKLTEVGCTTGKLGHLTVDQAEDVEEFIRKEAG